MAELKTRATGASGMQEITQARPKMWGTAIVGFGSYHYTNSTKQQYEWFRCGFSPRKQALTDRAVAEAPAVAR